jgi:anti-sigma B factor antagonist
MSDLARITAHDEDDLRVVEIAGEVDASNADDVRVAALTDFPNTAHGLILDLRALDYIDSAGIAVTFDLAERLTQRGQCLVLVVGPSALIRHALAVTEIESVAPLVATLEAARSRVLPGEDERTA